MAIDTLESCLAYWHELHEQSQRNVEAHDSSTTLTDPEIQRIFHRIRRDLSLAVVTSMKSLRATLETLVTTEPKDRIVQRVSASLVRSRDISEILLSPGDHSFEHRIERTLDRSSDLARTILESLEFSCQFARKFVKTYDELAVARITKTRAEAKERLCGASAPEAPVTTSELLNLSREFVDKVAENFATLARASSQSHLLLIDRLRKEWEPLLTSVVARDDADILAKYETMDWAIVLTPTLLGVGVAAATQIPFVSDVIGLVVSVLGKTTVSPRLAKRREKDVQLRRAFIAVTAPVGVLPLSVLSCGMIEAVGAICIDGLNSMLGTRDGGAKNGFIH